MTIPKMPLYVCPSDELQEGNWLIHKVRFQGMASSIILLRYKGQLFAYHNRCVHMPRSLDCQSCSVFDEISGNLRCTMHGIHYSSQTGESLSEICRGKKLTAIRVIEDGSKIHVKDKRVDEIEEQI